MFGVMEMFSMSMSSTKWVLAKWWQQILKSDFTLKPTEVQMKDSIYQKIRETPLEEKMSVACDLEKTWAAQRNYNNLRDEYRIFD